MATIELTVARHGDQQTGTAVTVAELLATFGLTATGHRHRHRDQYEESMITVAELLGRRSGSGAAREAHTAPSPSIHPLSLASSPAKSSVLTGSQARGRGLLLATLAILGGLLAILGGLLLATLGGLLVVAVAVTVMIAQPLNTASCTRSMTMPIIRRPTGRMTFAPRGRRDPGDSRAARITPREAETQIGQRRRPGQMVAADPERTKSSLDAQYVA
jgi:hypothetical protein